MVSLPMRERVAPKTGERSPESLEIGEVDEAAPVATCSLRLGDPGDGKGTRGFNVSRLCSGHQRARSRFDGSCGSSRTARTPTVVFTVDVSFCRSCFFFRRCNTARSGLSSEASAAAAFRSAAERPPRRSMLLGARAPFRFSLWLLPQMGLTQSLKPTKQVVEQTCSRKSFLKRRGGIIDFSMPRTPARARPPGARYTGTESAHKSIIFT